MVISQVVTSRWSLIFLFTPSKRLNNFCDMIVMNNFQNSSVIIAGSPVNSPPATEEGPSGVKTTLCPVCEEVIHGSSDELNSHVEVCLRKVH